MFSVDAHFGAGLEVSHEAEPDHCFSLIIRRYDYIPEYFDMLA